MKDPRNAYIAILLLGIVSLMGDIVYEGSRSLIPEYLGFLGASSVVVGFVGGFGDFLGYASRLVTGFLTDMSRAYWLFMFLGYGLIISIPLLGLSSGLEVAIFLVLIERFGKALRSPSRDSVLSMVSKDVGSGKAFGLHELLDQVGAVIGPAIVVFLMLSSGNNYRHTFVLLFIPFLILLIFLAYTYKKIRVRTFVPSTRDRWKRGKMSRPFLIYTFAVLLNAVGLIPQALILFSVSVIVRPVGQEWIVPLTYLLIQAIDAPSAFISGYAFDRWGIQILLVPFLLSIFPPILAMFDSGLTLLILAAAVFGLVLGMQESIYRAAVSEFTDISMRGTAYGIFHTAYGFGFLTSGLVYGLLIQARLPFILTVVYVSTVQTSAIVLLLAATATLRTNKEASVAD